MTATEAYDLTTRGGAAGFAAIVAACESAGPYCLIGGLAVNAYVEPVYTLDADIVVAAEHLASLISALEQEGFVIQRHPDWVNAATPDSDLRIQFTTDPRYQDFPSRAVTDKVLGQSVRIASLRDVVQGKLWAYSDPARRLSKRKKDELDLIRLAEAYPELKALYPPLLVRQIEAG